MIESKMKLAELRTDKDEREQPAGLLVQQTLKT